MAGTSSSGDATRTSLDGHGVFAIVVFAIVSLICIQPVYIPVPHAIARKARAVRQRLVGDADEQQRSTQSDDGQQQEEPSVGQQHHSASSDIEPPAVTTATVKSNNHVRAYITLNHVWTPAIGILFLLATMTIGGEQIKLGIVGEEGVEPYDVLIFFISLAYIAISLDATGLLRYLAFQVCLKAGTSGMRLYLVLYGFFWTLGVLVGNDPVILSGTAFLVYLTRVAGISPPSAWIWGQFVAANVSSAVLVSSNPTNLVIASGFNISFPVYTAYMVLPAFVSALAALLAILLFFRNEKPPGANAKGSSAGQDHSNRRGKGWTAYARDTISLRRRHSKTTSAAYEMDVRTNGEAPAAQATATDDTPDAPVDDESKERLAEARRSPVIYIPKTIVRPDVDPKAALVDPKGAIFVSVVMAATLITVIVTNVTGGAKVYMVALPGAGVCIVRDIAYDWYTWRSIRKERQSRAKDTFETQQQQQQQQQQPEQTMPSVSHSGTPISAAEASVVEDKIETQSQTQPPSPSPPPVKKPLLHGITSTLHHLSEVFPTVSYVFARLPFPLLPFAFGMFILVQGLAHVGFINILAGGLGNVCGHGYVGCSFFISTLGVILCNLGGTNIGATILLTRALQSTYFQRKLPVAEADLILRAASYSVAFGSNVGALGGTFAASLAGLLWRDGLLQRGVVVTKMQFLLWCAVVIVPALVAGVAVLIPQVRYFHVSS